MKKKKWHNVQILAICFQFFPLFCLQNWTFGSREVSTLFWAEKKTNKRLFDRQMFNV